MLGTWAIRAGRTTIGGRQRPPAAAEKLPIEPFRPAEALSGKARRPAVRDAWSVADNSLTRRPLLTRLNGPTPSHRRVRNPAPHRDAAFIGFRPTKTAATAPPPSWNIRRSITPPLHSFISANSSFSALSKVNKINPPPHLHSPAPTHVPQVSTASARHRDHCSNHGDEGPV